MQFQAFPEKESRPDRKTAGAPQLPYETGSVKIQRAFLTSAHLLEAQYSGGKGDTQVFFHWNDVFVQWKQHCIFTAF